MLQFIKNMVQLTLSPGRGWEDVSASGEKPDMLFRKAYYPFIAIVALSEFVRLFYHDHGGVMTVIELAIALFGSYFVSYFISRLILDHYLQPLTDGDVNEVKTGLFTIYGLGLLAMIEMIANVLPTDLTLVKFLPLFVALILYKGAKYMAVKPDHELRFLCLAVAAVIVVPIGIFCILRLIIE